MSLALAFLSTGLGRAVAAIGIVIAAYVYGYASGRDEQSRLDKVASLQAELAAAKVDAAISRVLASVAEEASRAAERAAAENRNRIDDYEKALARRPDARCALDADDVRRLRALNPAD